MIFTRQPHGWLLAFDTRQVLIVLSIALNSYFFVSLAEAKTPGSEACYKRLCWRIATLEQLDQVVGQPFIAQASWYDAAERDPFNPPGLTSSGEVFNPFSLGRVASPNVPNGTRLLLWSSESGSVAVVVVNNTGPFSGQRVLDVPRGLAEAMGFAPRGVAQLHVVVLAVPTEAETRHSHRRTYAHEGGLIGNVTSLEAAYALVQSLGFVTKSATFAVSQSVSQTTDFAPQRLTAHEALAPPLDFGRRVIAKRPASKQRRAARQRAAKRTKPAASAVTVRQAAFGDR